MEYIGSCPWHIGRLAAKQPLSELPLHNLEWGRTDRRGHSTEALSFRIIVFRLNLWNDQSIAVQNRSFIQMYNI